MGIQCLTVIAQLSIDDGKVEVDDEILVAVRRRVIADVEPTIKAVKLIRLVDVVVMLQHRDSQALTEPSWTDEEEVAVGILYLLNEPRLVDIVTVIAAHIDEIHHPVWNPLAVLACVRIYHKYQICSKFTKVERNRNK